MKKNRFPISNGSAFKEFSAVPYEKQGLPTHIWDFIFPSDSDLADKYALHFFLQGHKYDEPTDYTFAEWKKALLQTEQLLKGLGIGPKDHVAILLPNIPEMYMAFWGAACTGIACPIDPKIPAEDIRDHLNALKAKVLITLAPFPTINLWKKVESIRSELSYLKYVLQVDMADYLKGIGKMGARVSMLGKGKAKKIEGQKIGDFNRSRKKLEGREESGERSQGRGEEVIAVFMNGSNPIKRTELTHRDFIQSAWGISCFLDEQEKSNAFFGGNMPVDPFSIMAQSMLAWHFGQPLVMGTPEGWDNEVIRNSFGAIADYYEIGYCTASPDILRHWAIIKSQGFTHPITAISTNGYLSLKHKQLLEQNTPLSIRSSYTLLENGMPISIGLKDLHNKEFDAGLLLPYQEIRIIDENPEKIGIVQAKEHSGEWKNSGSWGSWNETEGLSIFGNRENAIHSGNHAIIPYKIENAFLNHDSIRFAAVIPQPNPEKGEVAIVIIEWMEGKEISPGELYEAVKPMISEADRPSSIRIVNQMPLTPSGSIDRKQLREMLG